MLFKKSTSPFLLPNVLMALALLLTLACNVNSLEKVHSWEEKRMEITDSLKSCSSLLDSIICLNRFAFRDIPHGALTPINCDSVSNLNERENWNAEDWYARVVKDSITVTCACHSGAFNRMVRAFFQNRVVPHGYSIGIPRSTIGHYLSLLITIQDSKTNMLLFDPMFNGYYMLTRGTVADLRHLIYLARSERTDLFEFKTEHDLSSYLVDDKIQDSTGFALADLSTHHFYEKSSNPNYSLKLRAERTIDHYLASGFSDTYQQVARHYNGPALNYDTAEDFKTCLLFSKGVYGPYSDQISDEVDYYLNAPLEELDALFDKFGLSVEALSN